VATGIVWAWVITMPCSALLAAGFYELARFADRMWG
jgi:phosphate/sulfate permease